MKLVRGYQAACDALSRKEAGIHFETSAEISERLRVSFGEELSVDQAVNRIIDDVRRRGDAALFDYSIRFDGVTLPALEVANEEYREAQEDVPVALLDALNQAAERVRDFHMERRGRLGMELNPEGIGTIIRPLNRVGIYIPGGRACYPSTVLMTVVPARTAGVGEIILCTPPGKDGKVPVATLAAAKIAGADRVFKVGGAQAVAAMAYGTETLPAVDKICGPGNIFVTLAKKAVFGVVDIDGLQGPSELVVVADESANPAFCAADLLAQGEHDPLAAVVLITTSERIAHAVGQEIHGQIAQLSRGAIAADSVLSNGILAIVDTAEQAIELVNGYAPEHVSLEVQDAGVYLDGLRNAGCIFVGNECPPALGDFVAGPSHVLPTGGTARFSSPLGVHDFLKVTSIVSMPGGIDKATGSAACTIAQAEGFDAHCKSIALRMASRG